LLGLVLWILLRVAGRGLPGMRKGPPPFGLNLSKLLVISDAELFFVPGPGLPAASNFGETRKAGFLLFAKRRAMRAGFAYFA
jgi:hypothetical protein